MSYFDIDIPITNQYFYSNSTSNDVTFTTTQINPFQPTRIMMGTTSNLNTPAAFVINSNTVSITNTLTVPYITTSNITTSNITATTINGSGPWSSSIMAPQTDNTLYIGTSNNRLSNIYTVNFNSSNITAPTLNTSNVNASNVYTKAVFTQDMNASNYFNLPIDSTIVLPYINPSSVSVPSCGNLSNVYNSLSNVAYKAGSQWSGTTGGPISYYGGTVSASNLSVSSNITASNINFTGQLQQNGVQFSGSPFSTSNLNSSSFTAQASSYTGTNYPYYAIDQNSSTQWESVGESGNNFSTYPTTINTVGAYGGEWLQINMPTPITVTTMTLLNSYGNNSSFWPTSWRLAGYSNAVWYPIGGVQSGASPFTFNSGTAYSSFRICIAQSANTMVWISEVVFNSPIQLQQYILPGCMTLTGNLLANAGVTNSLYYYSSIQFSGNSYWNGLTQILGMPASITYITANSLNWIVPVSGIWSLTANLILYAGGASWTTFNVGITKNANPTSQSQTGISINNDLTETIGSGCNWLADLNTYNTQGLSPTILSAWQAYGYNLACTTILFAGETIQIHCSLPGLSVGGSMRNALIQQISN